ncbi:MAG: exo-alpha-sialidase, partial [Saprospiraceae bacterium]|nr:exo-alpha-sialidase [Saprospiraceae bacterium]
TSWSPLTALGDWGGIVVMGDVVDLHTGAGHYLALFHDDERYFTAQGRPQHSDRWAAANQPHFSLYKSLSFDGGLTWSFPEVIYENSIIHLCEPGIIRSPDGKQLAVLLRENSRRLNSFIIFSNDEGVTWTPPRELPNALTGDRHQAIYTPDGRLLISFRDNSPALARLAAFKKDCLNCDEEILLRRAGPVSPTAGDWVGWVGTYQDLVEGSEGQYRIRFKDNTKGNDCAYPALEVLADKTIHLATYGHWEEGQEPYILSLRFKMDDLDSLAK